MNTIVINEKWCKQCGICATFCPKKVYDRDEDGRPLPSREIDCIGCLMCEKRCPEFAIKVKKED
ncbi:ferredoxin family protein [Peptococcus simiae]|uniref:4Fe-4S dicluster domain-containing protein n=1 Tax=Peptococcus simiae TaxID=1643805 RepID=UPI0039812F13